MAPPRTAQKPTALAVQTNSRRGRNARRQAEESLDDENSVDDSMDVDEANDDDEIDPSQGTAVQNMILGSLSNQKKRHVVNKKQVKEKYSRTKIQLQDDTTALFAEHEEQAETAHSAQLKRLADLIALKASIEARMTSKLAYLQTMYNTHSRELSDTIDSRVRELQK